MDIEPQYSSTAEIIATIEQMPSDELDDLVRRVLEIRAARRAPLLSLEESNLLKKINLGFSQTDHARLSELQNKREREELSENEYEELARLTDRLEELHATRMEAISKLADIRGLSLKETMTQLNIKLPDYD